MFGTNFLYLMWLLIYWFLSWRLWWWVCLSLPGSRTYFRIEGAFYVWITRDLRLFAILNTVNMKRATNTYRTFILRLWSEGANGSKWRYSLEDTQTGERRGFVNLIKLLVYLDDISKAECNNLDLNKWILIIKISLWRK